MITHRS